ncbi:MAG TPA: arginine--tRNA ligase [Deltaproteobacteria bacterium]|nr:arginine--tRNA ligase [Deltaproteobacteria bacterium]
MKDTIERAVTSAVEDLTKRGLLPPGSGDAATVSIPQNKEFGDYATNIAMISASRAKKSPREIASLIRGELEQRNDLFSEVTIAGPGFINFTVRPELWIKVLDDIHEQGTAYGCSAYGQGRKVQVEFVSANPTGPLHIGHGRGAAVGDTLVRIMKTAGYEVQAEYYINDIGNQMNLLGLSVLSRYRELFDQGISFPENGYQGEYIRTIASELTRIHGEGLLALDHHEAVHVCREYAARSILEGIKDDLIRFEVHFDNWFSESSLYDQHKVDETLEHLKTSGLSYENDGALWFRTTRFGDEKDRVLRKQDGSLTYFAPDIAYHRDKLERGFTKIIDIWGADHHGYVPRMRAAIQALDSEPESFHALLIQLVSLVRDGKPVSMSTRSGEFVTLREILDEVGTDAARYFFLMRRCDSHLVFDLDLAKKKTEENPVFYIQYAHARICSILRNAAELGLAPDMSQVDRTLLEQDDDLDLIKVLATYPDVLVSCAADLEPHRVAFYLLELATEFHRFYNKNRVISESGPGTMARLVLVDAVRQVLVNALALMGIVAPESM